MCGLMIRFLYFLFFVLYYLSLSWEAVTAVSGMAQCKYANGDNITRKVGDVQG